jgi:two-component system, NarL family, invasion response regulator UvrY
MTQVESILLVDNHPLVRAGCQRVLRAIRARVVEATTAATAIRINRDERPKIIFLDISLPDANGTDILERLLAENVGVQVIILTMYEDVTLARRLIRRGASAYLTKSDSPECMLRAIERVSQGACFISPYLTSGIKEDKNSADERFAQLSPRDRRIIELLGDGKSLSEISYELGQSYKTVANVTNMIRNKFGFKTNSALIKLAVERRLKQLP